jgi:hypothetical protein
MTNAEIPMGRQAERAWKRLDAGVRKDVLRRARQGMGHPDPAMAAIAIGRARYALSLSFSVRYWSIVLFVITGAGLGLAAVLDRVARLGPLSYVVAFVPAFSVGVMSYTMFRRDAKQMGEANMSTFRAGHTDHGSLD